MLDRIPTTWLGSQHAGPSELLSLVLRLGAGGFVTVAGIGKFAEYSKEVDDFRSFGVPLPEVSVPVAGTIEVVGGILVVVGLLTRFAALAVAANLLGALLTAGINEGGTFHLVVGPTVLVLMLAIAWLGAGRPSIDARIVARRDRRLRPAS